MSCCIFAATHCHSLEQTPHYAECSRQLEVVKDMSRKRSLSTLLGNPSSDFFDCIDSMSAAFSDGKYSIPMPENWSELYSPPQLPIDGVAQAFQQTHSAAKPLASSLNCHHLTCRKAASANAPLQRCSGCRSVYYCSVQCQQS